MIKSTSEFYRDNLRNGYKSACKSCCKIYQENNKEKIKITKQNHYKKHKEQIREYNRKYKMAHKEKIYKKQTLSNKKRYHNDPAYKISCSLRNRIRSSIKNSGISKDTNTIELLGCSFKEAKIYLESKFTNGMTWNNYGYYGWHIDHIRPCASFDLTDPEQQKQCFHYSNLQPLWAKDNLSKSKKWS